jgi:hypothetical protein
VSGDGLLLLLLVVVAVAVAVRLSRPRSRSYRCCCHCWLLVAGAGAGAVGCLPLVGAVGGVVCHRLFASAFVRLFVYAFWLVLFGVLSFACVGLRRWFTDAVWLVLVCFAVCQASVCVVLAVFVMPFAVSFGCLLLPGWRCLLMPVLLALFVALFAGVVWRCLLALLLCHLKRAQQRKRNKDINLLCHLVLSINQPEPNEVR